MIEKLQEDEIKERDESIRALQARATEAEAKLAQAEAENRLLKEESEGDKRERNLLETRLAEIGSKK